MIGKLKGVVDAVGTDDVVLDVNGVGYLVACGARALSRMPSPGEAATLHIETIVREDLIRLYGFLTEEERAWFVRLTDVQGVGAKVALAILDVLGPGEIAQAIVSEDKASVSRAQGVGPRLAQRIVTELKGKDGPATRYGAHASGPLGASAAPAGANGAAGPAATGDFARRADAVSALINLGLEPNEARAAVMAAEGALGADAGLDAILKSALKELGR